MKPPSMESVTRVALIQLEEQRIVQNLKTESLDNEDEIELAKRFYASFERVAKNNVDLLSETVSMIRTKDAEVTDRKQIIEFLGNIPSSIVGKINKSVEQITKKPEDINTFKFVCPEAECGHKETIKLEMNPVNFSVAG